MLTYLRMAPFVAILLLLAWGARVNDLRDRWHHQYEAEHTGRLADRAGYTAAQAQAQADNQAKVAQVKAQQEAITHDVKTNLSARLELIRRELRKGGTAPPQGSAGSPNSGNSSPAPCRATDPAWLCLSPSDRLRAAENEERHDELIDWSIGQAGIDPNKP